MKKKIAWILIVSLILGLCQPCFAARKYTGLTVGTTTPFSGNFFSGVFGDNISDMDVQYLVHGCSPVYWQPSDGSFKYDSHVVSGSQFIDDAAGNRTYYLNFQNGMKFSDGSPITAWDYAFSLLLLCSGEMAEVSGNTAILPEILGCADYRAGKADALQGVRVYSDDLMSISIGADYRPYYYEVSVLNISPYPISVLAPGCSVKDDGNGAWIDGPFDAEVLRKTMLDPETGYLSHPSVCSGPYMLESYDGEAVQLTVNPYNKGNQNGQTPRIENIEYRVCKNENMLQELISGRVDMLPRCTRKEIIQRGVDLVGRGELAMVSYPRSGYSFFSFCCEKDTVAETEVRKAISLCLDKQAIVDAYVGGYGLPVEGDYGIGQWMYQDLHPDNAEWETEETEEETGEENSPAGQTAAMLAAAGWMPDEDGIRCKEIDGKKVRLELKVIYPEGNQIGNLIEPYFAANLREAGVSLEAEAVAMDELLRRYYRYTERDCDMIYLATNYSIVYDPVDDFDPNENDTVSNTTGLKNRELYELALEMRKTEPGDTATYNERWSTYQAKWKELMPVIPVYSNTYYDFYVRTIQDYEGVAVNGWAEAVVGAYLGDRGEENK